MDLQKSGGLLELAIINVRRHILPEVYVNYHMVSKFDYADCYNVRTSCTFTVTCTVFRYCNAMVNRSFVISHGILKRMNDIRGVNECRVAF